MQSKGRLYDDTMALLNEADVRVPSSRRTLLVRATNFPVEVLYLRDDDIPRTVADGVADVGVVGLNELREQEVEADVVRSLGFGACRLSLAVPASVDYTGLKWFDDRRIATSYPRILSRYLEQAGVRADVHVITGSVEVSTSIGLADAIFDIVSSGSTLVSNNLREVETVMKSEAVLIAHPDMSGYKHAILDELLFRIKAVQDAGGKKYVLMNVPRSRVEEVLAVLPGIKSPTVMPLADADWCSVHTVLDEDRFWEIIGQLKEKGAQGILVLPIEKMVV